MKRLRVIIIDDEFRVSKLIEKLINWEKLNLECVAVINDGETAVKAIITEEPDIIITDISMPKVSGLDIIERFSNTCKFIIISGYKDFEYAHQAMMYGVSYYLLKPVDKIELNENLEKLSSEIAKNKESLNEKNVLKLEVAQSNKKLRDNLFSSLIDKKDLSFSPFKDINCKNNWYKLFIVKLDYCEIDYIDKLNEDETIIKVKNIIFELLKNETNDCIIVRKSNLKLYTIVNCNIENFSSINNTIFNIFEKIKIELNKFEIFYFTVGILENLFNQNEIISALNLCEKVINNRIKLGTNRIITDQDISLKTIDIKNQYSQEINYITKMIFSNSEYDIKDAVFELFNKFRDLKEIDYSIFYEVPKYILDKVFSEEYLKKSILIDLKNNMLFNINYAYSSRTLAQYISKGFIELARKIEQLKQTKNLPVIRKINKYIEENYNDKITLEDVANEVCLNPIYLSSLFKKETGKNFTTYLTNYRIDMAKIILTTSSDTIAAIASKTGYNDSRYFSQTFKKVVGIKPTLYRKIYANYENKED
jgi:two-component system response regulator YesN